MDMVSVIFYSPEKHLATSRRAPQTPAEIPGLNEDEVIDDTDIFEAGGGSLQVRKLIHFMF
jgi:hypothetical protein